MRLGLYGFIFFTLIAINVSSLAQGNDLQKLNEQIIKLKKSGKNKKALKLSERYSDLVKEKFGKTSKQYILSLESLGLLYDKLEQPAKKLSMYTKALALQIKLTGAQHPDVGKFYMLIALHHYRGQSYDEALTPMMQAYEIFKKTYGEKHPTTLTLLTAIADVSRRRGEFDKAEKYLLRLLKFNEEDNGVNHVSAGAVLNVLAQLYTQQEKFIKAEKIHLRLMGIRRRAYGEDHHLLATSYHNLADTYYHQSKYIDAKKYFEQALRILRKQKPQNNLQIATTLESLGSVYSSLDNYQKAEALLKEALKLDGDPSKPSYANKLFNLSNIYQKSGEFKKSEETIKQAIEIVSKTYGSGHFRTAVYKNSLALIYSEQNQFSLAEKVYKESLAQLKKTFKDDNSYVMVTRNNIASLYIKLGRFDDAVRILQQVVSTFEKTAGKDHEKLILPLNNLGSAYREQGKFNEARTVLLRAIKIQSQQKTPSLAIATVMDNLAILNQYWGKYQRAEGLYKQALKIREDNLGQIHADIGISFNNLASLYSTINRSQDAQNLYEKALTINEKIYGKESLNLVIILNNLAHFYYERSIHAEATPPFKHDQKLLDKAKALIQKALKIQERHLDPAHESIAVTLTNFALVFNQEESYRKAEEFNKRALKIRLASFGENHPEVATSRNNLANNYIGQKRYTEASEQLNRSLNIWQNKYGDNHARVATAYLNLSRAYYRQGKWKQAYRYANLATQIYVLRSKLAGAVSLTGQDKNSAQLHTFHFKVLARLGYRAWQDEQATARHLFEKIQWMSGAGASAALSQMAVRFQAEDDKLAELVRQRQDLREQWKTLDRKLIDAKSKPEARRSKLIETSLQNRQTKVAMQIADIDKTLKRDFPEYAALATPAPVNVSDVQKQLRDDEALLYFVDIRSFDSLSEETFIWLVTKDHFSWTKSELGTETLNKMVRTLRCGLEATSWHDNQKSKECARLIKTDYSSANYSLGQPLPFDRETAHKLYQGLLGKVADKIKGKKLLLVPSGPLTSLPFQVLLTQNDGPTRPFSELSWLINDHDLLVLPSVASLKALRATTKTSKAKNPYFGVGNPLLTGPNGTDESAWTKQACNFKVNLKPIRAAGFVIPEFIAKYFRGGLANVEAVRRQVPLPETADELCAVADLLGASAGSVKLGENATETNIKQLSEKGELRNAKIIHFATHGLLSGETESLIKNQAEPSLILSPPDTPSSDDDGLLTASEIAKLQLDADWVILSACNTAAGEGKPGAESLSGLAKAFFYAGARALLVSHWYVNSDATVKLVTRSFGALSETPEIGRSGALRVAMKSLIRSKNYSHPENWAPFVLVGVE